MEYLKEGVSKELASEILEKLNDSWPELLRKKESAFKEMSINEEQLSKSKIAELISGCPQLLERPVVLTPNEAIIGRPVEEIEKYIAKVTK